MHPVLRLPAIRLVEILPVTRLANKLINDCEVLEAPDPNKPVRTILALNASRFRGELELLQQNGNFRIVKIPIAWQTRFYGWYYPYKEAWLDADKNPKIWRRRTRYRKLLQRIFSVVFKRFSIDLVMGASLFYRHDNDWGVVARQMGRPYYVFHRESNVSSRHAKKWNIHRARQLNTFQGSMAVFQNELQRDIYLAEGAVEETNSTVIGALRMDGLLQRIGKITAKRNQAQIKGRKKVVFFSFGRATGIIGAEPPNWPNDGKTYLDEFCEQTHVVMSSLAAENPEVDVVIKPKYGGIWTKNITTYLTNAGFDPNTLPNLIIDDELDVHQLLEEADVVIGFGSTTLLEAGICGLPVIMPWFAEAREEKWQDYILYGEEKEVFDLALSADELHQKIIFALQNPGVDPKTLEKRRNLFAKYLGQSSIGSVAAAIKLLNNDTAS
jgi:glycosyltransferase involved in cell wall biosynthesis